jgi:hypothetical protein
MDLQPKMQLQPNSKITISLPNFGGSASSSITVESTCGSKSGCIESASWAPGTLTLTVGKNSILADTIMEVIIPVSSGILVPADGIRENDLNLTFSSDTSTGPVFATPFFHSRTSFAVASPGIYTVGEFLSSELSFEPLNGELSSAGNRSSLVISFRAKMLFVEGDTITISLPGFEAQDREMFRVSGKTTAGETAIEYATWNESRTSLVLTFAREIPARTDITVETGSFGLVLPIVGVRENQASLTISTDAAAGPVEPTSILQTAPVGSFTNTTSLAFDPLVAAPLLPYTAKSCCRSGDVSCCRDPASPYNGTAIKIFFQPQMPLEPGDTVTLMLCGFIGTSYSQLAVISNGNGAFTSSWQQSDFLLTLHVITAVPEQGVVNVTVPSKLGILLPADGIYPNRDCLQIRSSAVKGPVQFTRILSVPVVGALWDTKISFGYPVVGEVSSIILSFTPKMPVESGKMLLLNLPNFLGPQTSCEIIRPAGATSFGSSRWELATHIITIDITRPVPADTLVKLTIPSTAIIGLPKEGIAPGRSVFTVTVNASSGPVNGAPILQLPSISRTGKMVYSELQYEPKRLFVDIQLTFKFVSNTTLNARDMVYLHLPGIKVTSKSMSFLTASSALWPRTGACPRGYLDERVMFGQVMCGPVRQTPSIMPNATWDPVRERLTIQVASEIPADTAARVVIGSSIGMRLPDKGVNTNEASFKASTEGLSGSAPSVSIEASPAVGGLRNLTLDFSPLRTTVPVDIKFGFVPIVDMAPDNRFQIQLRDFRLDPTVLISVDLAQRFDFDTGTQTLTIKRLGRSVPRGTRFEILIPAACGIMLPERGLRVNDKGISVSSDTSNIFATEFDRYPPVGIFEYASLVFSTKLAGRPTAMDISFRALMPIQKGETVTFTLPGFGFTGSEYTFTMAPLNERRFDKATWFPATNQLVLTCDVPVEPLFTVFEKLPFMAGFVLPAAGIRANDPAYTISTGAVLGPVLPIPILGMQIVSSLKNNKIDIYPRTPGARVQFLSIEFTPTLYLAAGSNVTFHLENFVGEDFLINVTSATPPGALSHVTWVNNATEDGKAGRNLTLFLEKEILEQQPVKFSINVSEQEFVLYIPQQGLVANKAGLIYMTDQGSNGTVDDTPFERSPGIYFEGSVTESKLEFFAPSGELALAGKPATIRLTMRAAMNLVQGDTIRLELPGFVGKTLITHAVNSTPPGKVTHMSWTEPRVHNQSNGSVSVPGFLIFTVASEIWGADEVVITVGADANISLPVQGVRLDMTGARISITADAGYALPAPLQRVAAIGSFRDTPTIAYDPPLAGAGAQINISFVPEMTIQGLENIFIVLPRFDGRRVNETGILVTSIPVGVVSLVFWDNKTNTLKLPITRQVDAGTRVLISIPAGTGIVLPETALERNWPSIIISTDAFYGPVMPTPLANSPAVGSLGTSTKLVLTGFGLNVRLQFSFIAQMDLLPSESLVLTLPLFSKGGAYTCSVESFRDTSGIEYCTGEWRSNATSDFSLVSSPANAMHGGTWRQYYHVRERVTVNISNTVNRSNAIFSQARFGTRNVTLDVEVLKPRYELQLFVNSFINRNTSVTITIDEAEMFRFPRNGVSKNQRDLTVRAVSSLGPMLDTSIVTTPPVGSFGDTTRLQYTHALAGARTGITFSFVPYMRLEPPDTIALTLEFFGGPSFLNLPVSSIPAGHFQLANWSNSTYKLVFSVVQPVPRETAVAIVVNFSAGMRIPENGLSPNEKSLLVQTEA